MKTYGQIYYEENKEKIKNRVKQFRENPEYRKKQCQWNKKWSDAHKDKVREIKRKSQRKIWLQLKKSGFVTEEIRNSILERDYKKCLQCGTQQNLTIDHIKPISLGGITKMDNLQTLCRSCNSKKNTKTINYRIVLDASTSSL